ncbi:hypothetical protein [Ureibacillus endophyticus]|uniref:Uncharacterized protein n=1 Tax=Ureibacillus endophyticus TaxID=1978490 RepID=A0A494Z334_9BACL|nr:hypothetical protein [Lysinibacillus endophyticus]RKQ16919.1 hypothetical protein D8M03_08560 [Lysinibacillus endophyticus]
MNLYLDIPLHGSIRIVNSKNQSPNSRVLTDIINSNSPFVIQANNNIVIDKSFWKPVPNVIRYTFQYLGNNQFQRIQNSLNNNLIGNSNYPDMIFKQKNNNNKLIGFILESPHEDEYQHNFSSMIPIAPAQNLAATGGVIHNEINHVLISLSTLYPTHFSNGEMIDIVILNPIPYQTSLFHVHQKALKGPYVTLRNNIWKCNWNMQSIKNEFHSILNIFSTNDILINCCTSQLQPILHTWLQNTLSSNPPLLLRGHHPSTLRMRGRWYQTIN